MIDEELVKQIFFYCKNNDPNGLYTDPTDESLDVLEFARKIEAVLPHVNELHIRLQEHARCVEIVKDMNKSIAAQLDYQKPEQPHK